jgi:hypothetical protein
MERGASIDTVEHMERVTRRAGSATLDVVANADCYFECCSVATLEQILACHLPESRKENRSSRILERPSCRLRGVVSRVQTLVQRLSRGFKDVRSTFRMGVDSPLLLVITIVICRRQSRGHHV